jgi:ATP-dependent protease HslVU (ClpYQ) peptidase subunit
MTTLVAVRKNNKIVLGADNRVSDGSGFVWGDNFNKIYNITTKDGRCKLATTGSKSGLGLYLQILSQGVKVLELTEIDSNYLHWDTESVNICEYLRKRGVELQIKWLEKKVPDWEGVLVITDKGEILSLSSRGDVLKIKDDYFARGSGTEAAIAAMYAVYDTVYEPTDIARMGLKTAHRFNAYTSKSHNIEYFDYGVSK